MDPREIWDIENIFELVEKKNNKIDNNIIYDEFENNTENDFYDFSEDDLPY